MPAPRPRRSAAETALVTSFLRRELRGIDALEAAKIVSRSLLEALDANAAATGPGGPGRQETAAAIARGLQAREELKLAEGGHVSADEVRRFLHGVSKTTVLDWYHKGRLVGWREQQNAVRFPLWQFTADGQVLPGLAEVVAVLRANPRLDDWACVLFFLNPRRSLDGRRPLDLLRAGETDVVRGLAATYAADE